MISRNLIDLTYLKDLSSGSNEFILKMLLVFLKQTPESVNNLEKYLIEKNWEALRSTAHKLKVSFMFLGVNELPDVISAVEEYAGNKVNLELLPEMIFKIKDISGKVMNELEIEKKTLI